MSRATTTERGPEDSPWILDGRRDLLLFVATPLLILPVAELLQSRLSVSDLALYVAAFGALGHHLPGMLRAYGDRSLFERFRARFLLSPVLLLAICLYFSVRDLKGLTVAVLLWGVWHGALQVYGFVRIYDAKVRSFARRTVHLDWMMCVLWFGAGTLFSSGRMKDLIEAFYASGGPIVHTSAFHAFRNAWGVLTVVVSVLFALNFVRQWRAGEPVSVAKPIAMFSGCAFWWYTSVSIDNVILGVALFEVFHDVQYLSIVWLFNRNRAKREAETGGFTRFLFRRSGIMIGLYVGLCFGYGAIRLTPELVDGELLRRVVLGVVAASTLLHFYYDGFIWKVRESTTREGLGIDAAAKPVAPTPSLSPWIVHALKWSFFFVPVAVLGVSEARGARSTFERYESMAELLPDSAYAQNNVGVELRARGRVEEAIERYERALAIEPEYARAHSNLGVALLDRGETEGALRHFERAVALEPEYPEALTNLASTMARRGRSDEARIHYDRALSLNPNLIEARNGLAQLLVSQGDLEAGLRELDEAIRLGPSFPDLHDSRGFVLSRMGRRSEAVSAFDKALALDPERITSMEAIVWLLATSKRTTRDELARAVTLGESAAELTEYLNASVLDTLGTAYAASGNFEKAVVAARTASALAYEKGQTSFVRDIEARIQLYEQELPYVDDVERGKRAPTGEG